MHTKSSQKFTSCAKTSIPQFDSCYNYSYTIQVLHRQQITSTYTLHMGVWLVITYYCLRCDNKIIICIITMVMIYITMVIIYITSVNVTWSNCVGSIPMLLIKYDTVLWWLYFTASCNGVLPPYRTTIHTVMIWYNRHLNESLHW